MSTVVDSWFSSRMMVYQKLPLLFFNSPAFCAFVFVKNVFTLARKIFGNNTFNTKNVKHNTPKCGENDSLPKQFENSLRESECIHLNRIIWCMKKWSAHDEGSFIANMNIEWWKRKMSRFLLLCFQIEIDMIHLTRADFELRLQAIRWLDQAIQQTMDILYHLIV